MATMTITACSKDETKDLKVTYDSFWESLTHKYCSYKKHKYKGWFYVKTPEKEEVYTYKELEELLAVTKGDYKVEQVECKYKVNKTYTDAFQEILNKYEKQGYRADAKQIALFMNKKITRLILQSK